VVPCGKPVAGFRGWHQDGTRQGSGERDLGRKAQRGGRREERRNAEGSGSTRRAVPDLSGPVGASGSSPWTIRGWWQPRPWAIPYGPLVESNSQLPLSRLDGGLLMDSGICVESSGSATPKQGPPRTSPFLCALRVEVFASLSASLGQAGRRGFDGSDGLKLVVARAFPVTREEPKDLPPRAPRRYKGHQDLHLILLVLLGSFLVKSRSDLGGDSLAF
jgi:hypothetical protein